MTGRARPEWTRRQYLIAKALLANPTLAYPEATEAVSSTAIEHPEWDMDEKHTWSEWEERV